MKAVRVHAFGGPEQLVLDELDEPRIQPSEVLVEIRAAGVNPVDTYVRSGTHAVKPPLPYIPGFDGAGVVLEVGAHVDRISVGGRVYVVGTMNGTYAERTVCAPEQVYRLPDSLTFPQGVAWISLSKCSPIGILGGISRSWEEMGGSWSSAVVGPWKSILVT